MAGSEPIVQGLNSGMVAYFSAFCSWKNSEMHSLECSTVCNRDMDVDWERDRRRL